MDEKQIFLLALEISDPQKQSDFLDQVCDEYGVNRKRIKSLLQAHSDGEDRFRNPHIPKRDLESTYRKKDPPNSKNKPNAIVAHSDLELFSQRTDYEIQELLGQGGMGTAYKARDVHLNRPVAIKLLAPHLAADETARKRFLREAQSAAAIKHPNVVTIYAIVKTESAPFLVMELIEGVTLRQKIDREGALAVADILRLGTQMADGLAAAHAQGIVHRDMKPGNVLLEHEDEIVKITDFGLARTIDDVSFTKTGEVSGTPDYMSPEQAYAQPIDHRSDLFSLGCILYKMCSGTSPFEAPTTMAVMKRVCEDAPGPLRNLNPGIPVWLEQIVNKLLAKNPDDRFRTATEVSALLGQYLAKLQDPSQTQHTQVQPVPVPPVETPSKKPTQRGRGWLIASVTVACCLTLFAVLVGAGLFNTLLDSDDKTDAGNVQPVRKSLELKPARQSKYKSTMLGATDRPVKVFLMVGDTNMGGRAANSLLKYQAGQPGTKKMFQHLIQGDRWVIRKDVWVIGPEALGDLTVGLGDEPGRFGPELEFGHIVGDYFEEQVLIIKTCYPGSLYRGFRPPKAGPPDKDLLEDLLPDVQDTNPNATMDDVKKSFGEHYRDMVGVYDGIEEDLTELFPGYKNQGYELVGFVWFQGWNDKIEPLYLNQYKANLIHFIHDVRKDLKSPKLPFVIGQHGVGGVSSKDKDGNRLKQIQAEVASLPEFRGNVKLVKTDLFWDYDAEAKFEKMETDGTPESLAIWEKVGSEDPFQYLGSAKINVQMGRAFAEAMLELVRATKKESIIE